MVINIGHVKNGDFDKVEAEIKALKEAAGDKILKVIIETCYLTDDEKVKLCQCVTNAKADYIKLLLVLELAEQRLRISAYLHKISARM